MFIAVGARSKSYACAGLFAFHCVLFCASAHCNVNCSQTLPILAANWLALSVVSLTEGTPPLSRCARHRDKNVSC